jgi:penicillin-binding protein 2B
VKLTEFNNYGAQLPYEPGSTLKTFCWAAAINENKYDGATDCQTDIEYCYGSDDGMEILCVCLQSENSYGCIYNASDIQHDGSADYDQGCTDSLNTVACAIQNELITPQIHLEYLKKFGFFSPVDTDGLEESSGTLNWDTPADRASLSYGQGSSVTMLQLLQAYSAAFGDGNTVKPYFVESIRDSYDTSKVLYQAETKITGSPITAASAKKLQSIMYETVYNPGGTLRYYQIPETTMIGKSGTTELAVGAAGYNSGMTIASIAVAMPADNPQVMVYYAFL